MALQSQFVVETSQLVTSRFVGHFCSASARMYGKKVGKNEMGNSSRLVEEGFRGRERLCRFDSHVTSMNVEYITAPKF